MTSYIHIGGFRQEQEAMDHVTTNAVACVIIGSRLEYSNVLLAGMSGSNLEKLQRFQNCLAQVVTPSRSHQTSS